MFRAKNNSIAGARTGNDDEMTGKKKKSYTKYKMKTNIPRDDEKERETPNQRTLTLSAEKASPRVDAEEPNDQSNRESSQLKSSNYPKQLHIEENNDQSNRDSALVNRESPSPDSEKLKT